MEYIYMCGGGRKSFDKHIIRCRKLPAPDACPSPPGLIFPRESARCGKACLWTGHRTNFPGDIKGAWWNLIGFPLIEPSLPARPGIASHQSEASRWKPEIVFLSQDKQTRRARNPGQTFSHFPQQRFSELVLQRTVEGFGRCTCFNMRCFPINSRTVLSNVRVHAHLHQVTNELLLKSGNTHCETSKMGNGLCFPAPLQYPKAPMGGCSHATRCQSHWQQFRVKRPAQGHSGRLGWSGTWTDNQH